jgi:uncharacterized protein
MTNKKTVVIGASENPERYSYMAVQLLQKHNQTVVAIGAKKGAINGIEICTELKKIDAVDTVTLYVNPTIQKNYYDYIIGLQPKRIIFNPGTENAELAALALQNNIQPVEACTLVMLNTGQY